MFKVGSKVRSSGGRLFDVRDSSILAVRTAASSTTVTLTVRAYTGGPATILWGDGSQQFVTVPSTGAAGETRYTHLYLTAGVYTIGVASAVDFKMLTASYAYKYNAGYYRKSLEYILHSGNLLTLQDVIPDYAQRYKYLSIDSGNALVDLSKLSLESCESFQVRPTATSVVGNPSIRSTSKLTTFYYYNYYATQVSVDLHELVARNPNLSILEVAYCDGAKVGYEDISDLQLPEGIASFVTYSSTRYCGDGAIVVSLFNRSPTFTRLMLTGCQVDGTLLSGDYYAKDGSFYLFNSGGTVGVKGDASALSFRFRLSDFRISFAQGSFGDISANLPNLNRDGSPQGSNLYLYNYGDVELNVAQLALILRPPLRIVLRDYTGRWYGDASPISSMVTVRTFDLEKLDSPLITGWAELVDGLYANRAQFSPLPKTFNCSTAMRKTLKGTYQAPEGYVKGAADGAPSTSREKLYVLVNSYGWTFTNI